MDIRFFLYQSIYCKFRDYIPDITCLFEGYQMFILKLVEEETIAFLAAIVDITFSPLLQKTVEYYIQKLHIKNGLVSII